MLSQKEENRLALARNVLSPSELAEYNKYIESGKPGLAPSKAAEFFALFLQGINCEEIARLNPQFGLGLILRSRIEYEWDSKKDKYVVDLFTGIREKVQNTQLSAVSFAADAMAAFQKLSGDKFKKYIQTGNPADLGSWKEMSFKTYKDFIELLGKLTGQDTSKTKVSGEILHRHVGSDVPSDRPLKPGEAAEILKALEEEEKK